MRWKVIPDFLDYEVSDYGLVRFVGERKWSKVRRGSMIKSNTSTDGYQFVTLIRDGKSYGRGVHRLMLMAFHPGGRGETRHLNGIRSDNRLENLAWGTRSENGKDKVRHGRSLRGSRHPCAKLTQAKADAIRALYQSGSAHTHRSLAATFGCAKSVISGIIAGRRW